jgi:hypothetical protein
MPRNMYADLPDSDLVMFLDIPPEAAIDRITRGGPHPQAVTLLPYPRISFKRPPEFARYHAVNGSLDADSVLAGARETVAVVQAEVAR